MGGYNRAAAILALPIMLALGWYMGSNEKTETAMCEGNSAQRTDFKMCFGPMVPRSG